MSVGTSVELDWLVPGACFKIRGERGVFKVREITNGASGHVIHAWGGTPNRERHRAFHIDRIRAIVDPPAVKR